MNMFFFLEQKLINVYKNFLSYNILNNTTRFFYKFLDGVKIGIISNIEYLLREVEQLNMVINDHF